MLNEKPMVHPIHDNHYLVPLIYPKPTSIRGRLVAYVRTLKGNYLCVSKEDAQRIVLTPKGQQWHVTLPDGRCLRGLHSVAPFNALMTDQEKHR